MGGFIGSVSGVIIGGLLWLVISGFVIGSVAVWAPPLVLGAALWWGAMRAYASRPDRQFTIVGVLVLCVIVISALYVEPVFHAIPPQVAGVTTGTTRVPLLQVKITLGLLAALGVGILARDFLKEP